MLNNETRLPCSRAGYTYVEIIVALALLGLVLGPLLNLGTSAYLALGEAGRRSQAVNLARGELEYLRAGKESFPGALDPAGGEELVLLPREDIPGYPGFRRCAILHRVSIDPGPGVPVLDLYYLEATVSWPSRRGEQAFSLGTYLAPLPAAEENEEYGSP